MARRQEELKTPTNDSERLHQIAHPFCCPECAPTVSRLDFRPAEAADCGAYVCQSCDAWFPYESDVADFAPPTLRNWERWKRFRGRYCQELGLAKPAVPGKDSADANGSADNASNARMQQTFFDRHAQAYDEEMISASSFWSSHDSLVLDAWIARIPASSAVIDLGAGTGRCTMPLAHRLDGSSPLVAVDVSFEMLRKAADKLRADGLAGRAMLAVGDCMNLSFLAPETFDIGVAHGLLHHVKEPQLVFASWDRIAIGNASLLIHDNNRSIFRPLFDLLMKWKSAWDGGGHEWHPVTAISDLREWARRHGFQTRVRTSVFVPPHLCELMRPARSRRLIEITDRWAGRIPFLRNQGGIILAEAYRGWPPLLDWTSAKESL